MPDWLPGLLVALVAIIPALWGEIRQHRKSKAETNNLLTQSYKTLVSDLRQQLDEERQGCAIRDEELRNVRVENTRLRDENAALVGYVQRLTAQE